MNLKDPSDKVVVIGSGGALGAALASKAAQMGFSVLPMSARLVSTLSKGELTKLLEREQVNHTSQIFYCGGSLNPSSSNLEEMNQANVLTPIKVAKVARLLESSLITFGSVGENWNTTNPYLSSKRALAMQIENDFGDIACHLQLGTLYGVGGAKSFMFLGQILYALRHGNKFRMSEGSQIRDYQHYEDVVSCVLSLVGDLDKSQQDRQTKQIFSQRLVTLALLASKVFDHFERRDLLEIGALEAQVDHEPLTSAAYLDSMPNPLIAEMRSPIPGVLRQLESQLGKESQ